jgi:uncharacterized YccA/Bax inhibitor family protein
VGDNVREQQPEEVADLMANPLLNDKALPAAAQRTGEWGPPQSETAKGWNPPITDGPVTPWQTATDRMTVAGSASATGVLVVLLLISAVFGWNAVETGLDGQIQFPGLAMVGIIVGFVAVMACYFKPQMARILGPIYAIGQGFAVGAISKAYESYYNGIVIQAAGATVGVLAVMLLLYRVQIIRVTDRFRRIVVGATLGIMVFYLASFVINLFTDVRFLQSSSLMSIAFSFFVAGIAAFNLALDFDFIEKGSKAGLPKKMEWFAALGLLVTLVWLYLEILRLLSKLRDR